jgi:hypothetical protein
VRCPNCNKFVGQELKDPEADSLEANLSLDDKGKPEEEVEVTGNVRLVLTCADCSNELAETNQDLSIMVKLAHQEADTHEVEIEDEEISGIDRYDGEGRPMRYRRHYYGAEVGGKVVCSCGAEATFSDTVEEQASGFEQLN